MEKPRSQARRLSVDAMNALRRIEALRQAASTDVQSIIGQINSTSPRSSFRISEERGDSTSVTDSPWRYNSFSNPSSFSHPSSFTRDHLPLRGESFTSRDQSGVASGEAVASHALREDSSAGTTGSHTERLEHEAAHHTTDDIVQPLHDESDELSELSDSTGTTGMVVEYESGDETPGNLRTAKRRALQKRKAKKAESETTEAHSTPAQPKPRAISRDAKKAYAVRQKLDEEAALSKRRAEAWSKAAADSRSKLSAKIASFARSSPKLTAPVPSLAEMPARMPQIDMDTNVIARSGSPTRVKDVSYPPADAAKQTVEATTERHANDDEYQRHSDTEPNQVRLLNPELRSPPLLIENEHEADSQAMEAILTRAVNKFNAAVKLALVAERRHVRRAARAFYGWREWVRTDTAVEATMQLFKELLQNTDNKAVSIAVPSPAVHSLGSRTKQTVEASTRPGAADSRRPVTTSAKPRPNRKLSPSDVSARPIHMDVLPTGKKIPKVEIIEEGGPAVLASDLVEPRISVVRVQKHVSPREEQAVMPVITIGHEDNNCKPTFCDDDSVNGEDQFQVTQSGSPTALRVVPLDPLGRPTPSSYARGDYWKQVQKTQQRSENTVKEQAASRRVGMQGAPRVLPQCPSVPPPPPLRTNNHVAAVNYVSSALTSPARSTRSASASTRRRRNSLLGEVLTRAEHRDGAAGTSQVLLQAPLLSAGATGNTPVDPMSRNVASVLVSSDGTTAVEEVIRHGRRGSAGTGTLIATATQHQHDAFRRSQLGLPGKRETPCSATLLETFATTLRSGQLAASTERIVNLIQPSDVITVIEPGKQQPPAWNVDMRQFDARTDGRHVYVVHDGVVNTSTFKNLPSPSPKGTLLANSLTMTRSPTRLASPMVGARVTEKTVMHDERAVGSVILREVKHAATAVDTFGLHSK